MNEQIEYNNNEREDVALAALITAIHLCDYGLDIAYVEKFRDFYHGDGFKTDTNESIDHVIEGTSQIIGNVETALYQAMYKMWMHIRKRKTLYSSALYDKMFHLGEVLENPPIGFDMFALHKQFDAQARAVTLDTLMHQFDLVARNEALKEIRESLEKEQPQDTTPATKPKALPFTRKLN